MPTTQTAPTSAPIRGARILVAEDDPDLRSLVALALTQNGFRVVEAEDGSALIDLLAESVLSNDERDRFDLVVSDIRMPGYTAIEALVGMRPMLSRTPVVLLTAFGDKRIHERALRLGASMVLDKPFELNDLLTAVGEVLQSAPERAAQTRNGE
jgi:two-component system response regulator (stage 0 sporulation protein F)